ncbi:MAG: B12-binding domain-containing protein, partial [Candidatus Bathyarchaeia archaeon]
MVSEEMFEKLEKAVTDGDDEKARELAKEALRIGVGPLDAIEKGLAKGVRKIGELFDRHEVFLPDLIMTGNAMKVGCD